MCCKAPKHTMHEFFEGTRKVAVGQLGIHHYLLYTFSCVSVTIYNLLDPLNLFHCSKTRSSSTKQTSPIIGSDSTMASQISSGAKSSSSLLVTGVPCFFFNILPVSQLRSWVFEGLGIKGITELIKLNDLL